MNIESVVLGYRADISDITRKVQLLDSLNKNLANNIGTELTRGFNVVSDRLTKVSNSAKSIKLPLGGSTKEVKQFTTVLKNADGQLIKVTQTSAGTGKNIKILGTQISTAGKSLSVFEKAQQKLVGTSSKLTTNFSNFSNINRTFASQLKNVGNVSKFVGTSLSEVSDSGTKTSKIFETTNGKFVQLTQTVKKLPNGIQQVNRSVKQMSSAQVGVARTIENTNKSARTFGDNLKTLASRALLTIPVWFALRGSIFGVFRTIKDGLGSITSFDRALQKLKRNVSATSDNVDKDFATIQSRIKKFSVETGVSVEDVTNAIQKFATVGFDLETALEGGLRATQLSITLFGDAEETANAFARTLRVMTEDVTDAGERQKIIAEALALTDKLWKSNAFNVDEFSGNLLKFASTAKVANLSINETLALLATLSTAGLANNAGRLLKTAVLKSVANSTDITKQLGLDFDPTTGTTLQFITSLVDKLSELKTVNRIPQELSATLKEFLSIKGSQPVSALIALKETLKENLALRPDLQEFNNDFKEQTQTINGLVRRYKNLNTEIGRAFVTGLTGGDKYQDTLKSIVSVQEKLNNESQKFGNLIKNAVLVGGVASLVIFNKQLLKTLALLKSPIALGAVAGFQILNLSDEFIRLSKEAQAQETNFSKLGSDLASSISKGFRGNLTLKELETVINDIQLEGKILEFDPARLDQALTSLIKIRDVQQKIADQQKIQETAQIKAQLSNQNRIKIAELVLKNELEILKAKGAIASELIEAEIQGRKQLGIQKDALGLLDDQLAKERALTKEKRDRVNIGSESEKLFEISKTEGVDLAQELSKILSGEINFDTLKTKGRFGETDNTFESLKKFFPEFVKQKQETQFFRGQKVTGEEGLRGGKKISTLENFERIKKPSRTTISLAQARAETTFSRLTQVSINQVSAVKQNTTALLSVANVLTGKESAPPITGLQPKATNIQATNELKQVSTLPQNKPTLTPEIAKLERLFQLGQSLTGEDAQKLVNSRAERSKQTIEVNVNVDGSNFKFKGSDKEANQLGENISAKLKKAVENVFIEEINNDQSPMGGAFDNRVERK